MAGGLRLPNRRAAFVPEAKLLDYLLDWSHEDGQYKAAFFSRFGFTKENWRTLDNALRDHVEQHNVIAVGQTVYGTSYTTEGQLLSPVGRAPLISVF